MSYVTLLRLTILHNFVFGQFMKSFFFDMRINYFKKKKSRLDLSTHFKESCLYESKELPFRYITD